MSKRLSLIEMKHCIIKALKHTQEKTGIYTILGIIATYGNEVGCSYEYYHSQDFYCQFHYAITLLLKMNEISCSQEYNYLVYELVKKSEDE